MTRKQITIFFAILAFIGCTLMPYPPLLFADDCYESSVQTPVPFMGNDGEIFRLSDGSIWEVKYEYEYLYEYYPRVVVCPDRGKLLVENVQLDVELLASPVRTHNVYNATWELFEETYIRGTVRGTIRKGHIFKTASGSVYEVTGLTLQIVLELYPDVLVLRNGSTYKLIIEGFDEPLTCAKLN